MCFRRYKQHVRSGIESTIPSPAQEGPAGCDIPRGEKESRGLAFSLHASATAQLSWEEDHIALACGIASIILQDLKQLGSCTPEELVQRLPAYTWNQVFTAVGQLCRDGRLTLRQPARFEYLISLSSMATSERRNSVA